MFGLNKYLYLLGYIYINISIYIYNDYFLYGFDFANHMIIAKYVLKSKLSITVAFET